MPTEFSYQQPEVVQPDTAVADGTKSNRRIGQRLDRNLPVHVKPMGPRTRRSLRALRKRRAELTNVSVSGGAITCTALRGVQMYSVLEVEADPGRAMVRVQRISPLDGGVVEYGVALLGADPAMQRVFHGAAPNSRTDVTWRWMAAE